ncbi:MAG: 50S ribosomal protein L25/general stress protein Ctc [Neisseria sp.]|nr:50S ribosomal protein L25/general stress protein Ctc [Neisseria sp.]
MSEIIKASRRENQGTGASRRLRRTGNIPAVIYGDNQDAVSISIDQNTMFYGLKKESFHTSVLKLDLDGKVLDVLVRDFQMHPFKQQVQHIDFQIVEPNKPLRVKVPLHLINGDISPAVKLHSGRISQLATSVELLVKPDAIPARLELDLKNISGGQILHLSDVTLPEGAVSTAARRGANPPVAAATGKNK